jgi:hypothetical protein
MKSNSWAKTESWYLNNHEIKIYQAEHKSIPWERKCALACHNFAIVTKPPCKGLLGNCHTGKTLVNILIDFVL